MSKEEIGELTQLIEELLGDAGIVSTYNDDEELSLQEAEDELQIIANKTERIRHGIGII